MSDQVRSKTKRGIIWFVTGAHVLLILVPGIVYGLIEWLKPAKPVIHKIVLTDKIPGQGNASDADPGGQPQPEQDLPPDPGDLSDIPDMPQPKPQPVPPKPKPVPPKPKPVPPKPQPVPPKPQPVPPKPKPVPPKPKPVPPKPKPQKTKRPTVEDIRSKIQRGPRTRKTVRKVVRTGRNTNPNVKRSNAFSNIASEIRAGSNSRSSGNSIGTGVALSYYDTVGSFLERLWKQDRPNSSSLDGKRPVVVVEFRIDFNGAIRSKRIISKSGIPVVDSSVERLLARISALPQPPAGANITQFTVNMRVNE